jgi:hypothetical protein
MGVDPPLGLYGPVDAWPKWVSGRKLSTTFLLWPLSWVSIPRHFLQVHHCNEVLHLPTDQIIGINRSDQVAPP